MTAPPARGGSSRLYTPRLLSLSAELADYPLSGAFAFVAQARSRTCGSTIDLGVDLDGDGRVERLGMQVSACAVGQSSAAVMARSARMRTPEDFAAMLAAIEAWLSDGAKLPDWPAFDALEPARETAGRHGVILLPWRAMAQALSSAASSR